MCVLLPSGETRNYINIRKERSRLWDRSLPLKKMKTRENKRKPVGIKKADSKILTSTPCRKVIKENHEKKTIKRQKKSEIAKKIEVFKKEVAKKERDEKKEMVNKARAQPGKKQ